MGYCGAIFLEAPRLCLKYWGDNNGNCEAAPQGFACRITQAGNACSGIREFLGDNFTKPAQCALVAKHGPCGVDWNEDAFAAVRIDFAEETGECFCERAYGIGGKCTEHVAMAGKDVWECVGDASDSARISAIAYVREVNRDAGDDAWEPGEPPLFTPDPSLYIEVVLAVGLVAATPRLLAVISSSNMEIIGTFGEWLVLASVIAVLFLLGTATAQGYPYVGNLLTTSLLLHLLIPYFMHTIATFVAPSQLAQHVELFAGLSLMLLIVWAIGLLDHPLLLDGAVSAWLDERFALATFLLVSMPLTSASYVLIRRPPAEAWMRRSVGELLVVAVGSYLIILLDLFGDVELIGAQLDILAALVALYMTGAAPSYLEAQVAKGTTLVAPVASALAYAVALFRYGTEVSPPSIVHAVLVGGYVAYTRILRLQSTPLRALHLFVATALAGRVTSIVTGEVLGDDLPLVNGLLVSLACVSALALAAQEKEAPAEQQQPV